MIRTFFHAWERRLAFRDDGERRVLPFDWGVDHLPPFGPEAVEASGAREHLHRHVELALTRSHQYFALAPPESYELAGGKLSFVSPVRSGVAENDRVQADYFPVVTNGAGSRGPAVLVLPQWNSKDGAQTGLCRLLNRFGLSALKLALPYHEGRKPPELVRADFTLSPNVGRTLQSCRQAVLDARAAVHWLEAAGHAPIGIVGTSLGSAIAFVAFAHEDKLAAGVFNHVSPYFADVVWRGISTRQVRLGLEPHLELEELRRLWLPLSPKSYYELVRSRRRPSLLVYGRYDLSFPPDLSLELVREFVELGIEHECFVLPCGHYTTAKFPFNWMDGLRIARFLEKKLSQK